MSKPIAPTIVAGLAGDGIVTWDSWVTSQVTLRDVFCHRGGLPEHGGDLLQVFGFDREDVRYQLRLMEPTSSFRSEYAYTNFGLTAAAVAAGTDKRTHGPGYGRTGRRSFPRLKLPVALAIASCSCSESAPLTRTRKRTASFPDRVVITLPRNAMRTVPSL